LRPRQLHQLVLGNGAITPFDQGPQDGEGAPAKLDRDIVVEQLALSRLQTEATEAQFAMGFEHLSLHRVPVPEADGCGRA
jgi:hypothetical protein